MEDIRLEKYTVSFGIALSITCIVNAVLVVLKELFHDSVFVWMKNATGHHWVTHGLIDVVFFVVLGLALKQLNSGDGIRMSENKLVSIIVGAVISGILIILTFYMIEG